MGIWGCDGGGCISVSLGEAVEMGEIKSSLDESFLDGLKKVGRFGCAWKLFLLGVVLKEMALVALPVITEALG